MKKNLFTSALFGSITLGSDPEILLVDNTSGKAFGARDCSTGTKESPEPVKNGAVQVDGMALEFNIDPASTIDQWVEYHSSVLDQLESKANAQNLSVCDVSLLDYSKYINTMNPTDDELIFGCDPDLNAGTGAENSMPDNDGSIMFRTAGGHVHVGFSDWSETCGDALETARTLVKMMDATLGLWSVIEDSGIERKQLYGKAGAFRVKSYGFEYRTLSNFWVFNDEHLKHVFTTVTKLMSLPAPRMFSLVSRVENLYSQIEEAINTNNTPLARELQEQMQEFLDA